MYHIFEISCILCFAGAAICAYTNNIQMATYYAVMGFYSHWLAEKEKEK